MKYYYCLTNEQFCSETDIFNLYNENPSGFDSFNEYLNNCLYRNNGELLTMKETVKYFVNQININTKDNDSIIDSTDFIGIYTNNLIMAINYFKAEENEND